MSTTPKSKLPISTSRGREREVPHWSPERKDVSIERQSEAVAVGIVPPHETNAQSEASSRIASPKPKAPRRDTAMSGWVMVNVEGAGARASQGGSSRSHHKSSSQSPPASRPNVRHRRSNSDSGLLRPQVSKSPVGNAPSPATMSAAAKTIAMIDAVEAKKEEQEKGSTQSGLRKIFNRIGGSESDGGGKGSLSRRKTPDGGASKGKTVSREESQERQGLKDKWKMRATPSGTVKPSSNRLSID